MAKRFIQYFEDSFKENWDLPAMTNYETKQTFKYSDVAREIAKLHILFKELDVKEDDKIAIIGANTPEWAMVFLATITYGAVAVPILHNFSSEDQENVISHSDAVLLFADELYADRLKKEFLTEIRAVFSLSDFSCVYQRKGERIQLIVRGLYEIFEHKYPQGLKKEDVSYVKKCDDNEMITLCYTSGTTANSKGVMLSGKNFIEQIKLTAQLNDKNESTYISYIPLAHVGGFLCLLSLIFNNHIVFLPIFPTSKSLLSVTKEFQPSYLVVVPLILELIYKEEIAGIIEGLEFTESCSWSAAQIMKIRERVLTLFGNVNFLFIGGASLSPVIENFLSVVEIPYRIGYGLTETASQLTENCDKVIGSVGKPVEGVSILIDSDDPYNVPGEILSKGDRIMLGYYKNDELTTSSFTQDGWFKTGDMAIIDSNGYLYLKGRCKNLILTSSGQNVYPESIEHKLNQSCYVSDSVVVQHKNKIVAWIYPNYSAFENPNDVIRVSEKVDKIRLELNKHLASYEYIAEIKIHSTPFERTEKGSIKRYLYESIY